MASCMAQSRKEEELTCPVCRDIFKHPVLLPCSHSLCEACLQQWWTGKTTKDCPVCKTSCSHEKPPINLALRNLCENFLEERRYKSLSVRSEVVCTLHGEKLRLFCLDDNDVACLVCRDSENHAGHFFRPIDEAAQHRKEDIREFMKPLKEKLESFNQIKENYYRTAGHILAQAWHTELHIKKEFTKLHEFLQQEEDARISALREEDRQKRGMLTEKIDGLNREMVTLSETIRYIEAGDISFLQNYKTIRERVFCAVNSLPLDPQLVSGTLVNVAKHVGNLTFRVWDKMKDIVSYTPVILDPNTQNKELKLSDDLTSLIYDESGYARKDLPDNPERLESVLVMGSEGYNSGTHSWDVEVGDITSWEVGVYEESFQRKGDRRRGIWCLAYTIDGDYQVESPTSTFPTVVGKDSSLELRKIRVQLDWNRGKLSFYDADSNTHLHTTTHTFTGRLFPHFGHTSDLEVPLKVLPSKVCVTLEHHS